MKYKSVCCGNITLEHQEPLYYEICPVCFWENDPIQNNHPDFRGGANEISLNEAILNYKEFGAVSRKYISNVRAPYPDEQLNNGRYSIYSYVMK